jgi:hypothetical protein
MVLVLCHPSLRSQAVTLYHELILRSGGSAVRRVYETADPLDRNPNQR